MATGGNDSRLLDWLVLRPEAFCLSQGGAFDVDPGGVRCQRRHAGCRVSSDGAYWQLVTSMFTHVQLWHIGFNMLALYALGPQLELAVGRARFLALYFLSGLAGSALVYWGRPRRARRLRRDLRADGRAADRRASRCAATSAGS